MISLVALAIACPCAEGVTPMEKVIQLLDGMLGQGKSEKHEEQVQFAAYKQFCDDTAVQKHRAIKEAGDAIEVLQADISKHMADSARLGKEIAEHDADISTWNGDNEAATNVRTIESTDFDNLHKDYSESIDALERAVAVLKKQSYDREQATSFAQVSALTGLKLLSKEAKSAITAFLEQEPAEAETNGAAEGLEVRAPDAYGYEFRSHGVIEMLQKLHDKFIGERTDIEKKESNSKHAFDMLSQDLTAQIGQATKDRESKSGTKAKKLQMQADAEGDLTDTAATKAADEKYLQDLTATCEMKASDFESRQQLRTEEIEAIEQAIDILSGDEASGNAAKHLPTMLQAEVGSALAQLRAETGADAKSRAATFLRRQASRLNSRVLSTIATRASADPFAKVKKMIKDLLVRLMEEANEEAEHKGWCDTELSANEQTRMEKTEAVETLHAEIDLLEASISKLTEDIAELTKALAQLDSAVAKATTIRQEEKSTNAATIKDAQEAQTAVARALTVLQEFYAKAGEATALLQQQEQPVAPAIFDAPYKGLQAENGGVVGMLEVIQSDFARLEAATKAAEATAQEEYDQFMTDSKVDKAAKSQDIEHKTAKVQDETQALTARKSDLEGTQKELDAALAYFDKLKPSCIEAGVSYEDRVTRRKEEIESLQEALIILNGEDMA
jgi:prefoldin subunit 5